MKKYILSIIITLWLFPFALMAKGHIEYVEMPTKSALNNRPLMVYVPQDYYDDDDQDITYPVLFLLHGLHGDETSWTRKGDLFTSIDSVIDNDIIRPCIIIMPNTNGGKYIWRAEEHSLFYCVMHYGETKRNNFVDYFSEIMNYAAKHYRISDRCEDHALAGLSNGGRKAAEAFGAPNIRLVTPFWRADTDKPEIGVPFYKILERIRSEAVRRGIPLAEGYLANPRATEFFWDNRLHPNDIGFGAIADVMKDVLND